MGTERIVDPGISSYITLAVQYTSAQVASNTKEHRRIFFRLNIDLARRLPVSAACTTSKLQVWAPVGRGILKVGIVALNCPHGKHRPTADGAPIMTRQRGRVNPGGERLRA